MQVSLGRQLQQSITKSGDIKSEETQQSNNTNKAALNTSTVSYMLGITAAGMEETIQKDILGMIKKGQKHSLNGYVLCLSKIISHDIAWNCLTKAFSQANVAIPSKYYMLFNKNKNQLNIQGFRPGE